MDGAVMATPRMRTTVVAGTGVALLLAAGLATQINAARLVDQRVNDCGLSTPGNQVSAIIDLDHARNFWHRFPAALGAPELDNDNPALLVVFRGDYTWFRTGQVFQNVVCVYQDGYPHIYPNVNFGGANLEP